MNLDTEYYFLEAIKKMNNLIKTPIEQYNRDLFLKKNPINVGIIHNRRDYEEFLKNNQSELEIAKKYSQNIQKTKGEVIINGFCIICGKPSKFRGYMTPQWSNKPVFNEITNCLN